LVFDGRVAEDFKLTSGTWVNVGMLRVRAIAALSPVAQDIVITGHDRDEIGLLIFPNIAGCSSLCSDLPGNAPPAAVLAHPKVRQRVAAGLAEFRRENPGSSMHATRALLLREPPSIDGGEITDKGYINQRAVLLLRRESVARVYDDTHADTITPQKL
jgi:feruloyl-CoA synthase